MFSNVLDDNDITKAVDEILNAPASYHLVGGHDETASSGHAIGLIMISHSHYLGFDPNTGYYRVGNGYERNWLKEKLKTQTLEGSNDIVHIGFLPTGKERSRAPMVAGQTR